MPVFSAVKYIFDGTEQGCDRYAMVKLKTPSVLLFQGHGQDNTGDQGWCHNTAEHTGKDPMSNDRAISSLIKDSFPSALANDHHPQWTKPNPGDRGNTLFSTMTPTLSCYSTSGQWRSYFEVSMTKGMKKYQKWQYLIRIELFGP